MLLAFHFIPGSFCVKYRPGTVLPLQVKNDSSKTRIVHHLCVYVYFVNEGSCIIPLHAKVLVCQRELEMQILWLSLNRSSSLLSRMRKSEEGGNPVIMSVVYKYWYTQSINCCAYFFVNTKSQVTNGNDTSVNTKET